MSFRYVIKNGRVIDPALHIDEIMDVEITDSKITRVGKIDVDKTQTINEQTINAEGCFVTGGLIDYHTHFGYGNTDAGVPAAAACFPNGVTAAVDGGSTGVASFEGFYQNIVAPSPVDMKTMLHVSSLGQVSHLFAEDTNPALFEKDKILYFCEKYRDNIVALKLRQSRNIVKEFGLRPLKAATEISRTAGLRLVVHVTDSPGLIQETADMLSPGDVFCHLCHNTGTTILNEKGRVRPEVFKMQERGVLLDMAHGSRNFSLKIARQAISEGLLPDIISSDLSAFSLNRWPAFGFTYILSELLALGMSLPDLIKRCTQDVAKLINSREVGFIRENAIADISIFKLIERNVEFIDVYGDSQRGKTFIKCEMTFKNGIPMFRQFDF